ncbi:MAG: geranylgeranylglyceryl/heptaprenylglyceryl phosphate synthase [Fidelibacterota bacterium]
MSRVFKHLLDVRNKKGSGYLVLIDPDQKNDGLLDELVPAINESNVDAILVGGSLFMDGKFHERAARIKELAHIPVILFPGAANQLGPHFDAILFMSVISGRNANYLIGEQVISAPIVKDLALEPISTGYMLFKGGGSSTVEFMSNTRPLPMNRPDLAVAHGLAAEYLGMKLLYLEAGSGAQVSVPVETVNAVSNGTQLPVIVGGGIRTPDTARKKVLAGASFIVTGSVVEDTKDFSLLAKFAAAIHGE